jgi:hypothetical protein
MVKVHDEDRTDADNATQHELPPPHFEESQIGSQSRLCTMPKMRAKFKPAARRCSGLLETVHFADKNRFTLREVGRLGGDFVLINIQYGLVYS